MTGVNFPSGLILAMPSQGEESLSSLYWICGFGSSRPFLHIQRLSGLAGQWMWKLTNLVQGHFVAVNVALWFCSNVVRHFEAWEAQAFCNPHAAATDVEVYPVSHSYMVRNL